MKNQKAITLAVSGLARQIASGKLNAKILVEYQEAIRILRNLKAVVEE